MSKHLENALQAVRDMDSFEELRFEAEYEEDLWEPETTEDMIDLIVHMTEAFAAQSESLSDNSPYMLQ